MSTNLFINRTVYLAPVSWLCFMALLATASTVRGQPSSAPNTLYQAGRDAFTNKNYAVAIKNWERAYPEEPAMNNKALICENLAAAYEQLAADTSQPTADRLQLVREALRYIGLYNELRTGELTCLVAEYAQNLELQSELGGRRISASQSFRMTLDEFRSAYRRNPNPDLLYCIASSLNASAQDTRNSFRQRHQDAEQALRDYRDYDLAAQRHLADRPPQEVRQSQAQLQQLIRDLRSAYEKSKPVHKKTWFRAVMAVVAVGVAVGITAGITVRVLNPPDLLKVPAEAWSKDP